jgi:hypothetical protein
MEVVTAKATTQHKDNELSNEQEREWRPLHRTIEINRSRTKVRHIQVVPEDQNESPWCAAYSCTMHLLKVMDRMMG